MESRRNRVYKTRNLHNISNAFKHFVSVRTLSHSVSWFKHSTLSHTLSQSLKHSDSNTRINHPQPHTLKIQNQSPYTESVILNTRISHLCFSSQSASDLKIPYLENTFSSQLASPSPVPTEVQIFSSLKVCFSYKNLGFLKKHSMWV